MKVGFVLPNVWEMSSSRVRGYMIAEEMKRQHEYSFVFGFRDVIETDLDILYIQKLYDRQFIDLAKEYQRRNTKVVYDIVDKHPKCVDMLNLADLVVTDTIGNMEFCCSLTNQKLHFRIIEDPIDYLAYSLPPRTHSKTDDLNVIFFASPSNLECVQVCEKTLLRLLKEKRINLSYMSGNRRPDLFAEFKSKYIRWNPYTFSCSFSKFDMCIIPQLFSSKGNSKLVQSITHNVPAVSSDIPSYRRIAEATGTIEFLCKTEDDWYANLVKMLDPETRNSFLKRTVDWTWRNYNVSNITRQYIKAFNEVLQK